MITPEKLYETLGELAVAFSNLEHNVLRLLGVLARGDAFLGPILLNDLNGFRVLEYMKTYITPRLRENPELCERAKTLVREVTQVRKDRNILIHGLWLTDADLLASGRVSCLRFRFHYDEETDECKYLHDHKFTLNQLATKTAKTMILCARAMQLGKDIKAYLDSRD